MDLDFIAQKILQNIHEGSNVLKNPATNAYVYESLRRYDKLLRVLIASPDALMAELTKFLIDNLPHRPIGFDRIEACLPPIKEIAKILSPKRLNGEVIVSSENGCREADARMPLRDFKKALRARLFEGR